jgi:thioredoxin-like negative regulator of GroEL
VYFYVCAKDRFACEQQSKQFDEFADQYGAKVKVAYVDAEKQQELVSALGIQSVLQLPAHFVVADGQLLGSFSGVFSADELAQLITQVVQNPQTQQQDGTAGGGTNATPQPSNTQDSKTPTPSGK